MKRIAVFFLILSLSLCMTACENVNSNKQQTDSDHLAKSDILTVSPQNTEESAETENTPDSELPNQSETTTDDEKEATEYKMNIKIGEHLLTATLEQNSSADALLELLSEGSLTLNMSDYAGMEKIATLPTALPQNNENINTDACDLILYQGNTFSIYYDTNSWSLTRLGKIENITKTELKNILGTGDITVVLSLP